MSALILSEFDYSGIEPDLATKMRAIEERVRNRNQIAMQTMVDTGRDLLSVRDQIERGHFLAWIESRCGLSKSAAYRFMDVAERLADELPTVGSLPPTAIYQLASPTTPDPVRREIVGRLKAGETIAPQQIIDTVRDAREAERKAKEDAKLSDEERKRREEKERRQKITREQRAAENKRRDEERKALDRQKMEAAADAVALLKQHMNDETLRNLSTLISKCENYFPDALASSLGLPVPVYSRYSTFRTADDGGQA